MLPRTQTSLSLNVRAKEAGKETTDVCRLPSAPFPWSLAVHHQSLVSTLRKTKSIPHYNANTIHKESWPREIWIGYNIELTELGIFLCSAFGDKYFLWISPVPIRFSWKRILLWDRLKAKKFQECFEFITFHYSNCWCGITARKTGTNLHYTRSGHDTTNGF